MSSENQNQMQQSHSTARKVGVGLAVVALPVAAAVAVWQLKQADDTNNEDLERGFKYDVTELSKVDASLIGWKEVGAVQTHMSGPTCLAVAPDGKLLIGGDRLVKVLDPRGLELLSFAIPAQATAIAGSANGDIYVAMTTNVDVYGADGAMKASWGSVGLGSHISSVAVGPKAVYVADSGHRLGRALVFSLDGTLTGELAKANPAGGVLGISTPSSHMDIAVAADGNVWIANPGRHQLELYSPTGELLRAFGQSGTNIDQFLGCCNPSDFALLSDGRIVAAEKGVARVKVFKDDGHFVNVVAPPAAFGDNRAGIHLAADSSGRILALEPGATSVRIFAEARP